MEPRARYDHPGYERQRYRDPLRRTPRRRSFGGVRVLIALAFVGFALISYFGSSEYNPVTGEKQHISLTPHQEIALGLQAVPQMVEMHGGAHPDQQVQDLVDRVGFALVRESDAGKTDWQWEFTLLADPETVNAFALPGGQVFITAALLSRFEREGQLAGVLGHEIGHVVARHGAQRIAKQQLTSGILGGVLVATGGGSEAQVAQMVAQMVNLKYGREDELESDELGVRFMAQSGYDPRALLDVMRILDQASSGQRPPEFMSTHPSPENRQGQIEAAIAKAFPGGVPEGLKQ